MTRTILDIHILQTVPPSNINRDDTGAPKTAVYGGVRRARVSSQAWKRATRKYFEQLLPASDLGVRTKKVAETLGEHILALDPQVGDELLTDPTPQARRRVAVEMAAEALHHATGSKIEVPKRKAKDADGEGADEAAPESSYLLFLSRRQLDALATLAVEGGAGKGAPGLKEFFKDRKNKARAREAVDTRHSVDIALFGRMVADSSDLNVEAATQVAHAIGVHRSEVESDYYTAVDDQNTDAETGAGMIGSVDFNSATLYRYAALDVNELQRNLGAELQSEGQLSPTERAVGAFLEAFISSLPTGKINTFGNHTLPAAVVVKLRTRRPVSFVGAFEEPVPQGEEGGFLLNTCQRLADQARALDAQYGTFDGERTWVMRVGTQTLPLVGLGTEMPLAGLVKDVQDAVADRLGARA
ncbi:type I-E CRISPR-associated protein Cas7/Cse4/CasC [Streptomyces buecherae]|uniref:type I-E CRISPR-associated protein Cas7/Cse4/CasC n=1 Tax=Streptomyces buecherae TaxID=2763006 RepID=UPI00364C1EA3